MTRIVMVVSEMIVCVALFIVVRPLTGSKERSIF